MPPISAAGMTEEHVLVPACSECNTLLSNICLFELYERAQYLHSKLQKRYKKLLQTPDWTKEELDELGYTLREQIKNSIIGRNNIKMRLANLEMHF